jgi:hypothetical protein
MQINMASVPIKTAAEKGTEMTDDPLLAAAVCEPVRAVVAPVVLADVALVFWPVMVPVMLAELEEVVELLLELVAMLPPKSG